MRSYNFRGAVLPSPEHFCARRLSVERYSYSDVAGWVAGWLGVRHTPVLYQNG